jgi:hypothetical protein
MQILLERGSIAAIPAPQPIPQTEKIKGLNRPLRHHRTPKDRGKWVQTASSHLIPLSGAQEGLMRAHPLLHVKSCSCSLLADKLGVALEKLSAICSQLSNSLAETNYQLEIIIAQVKPSPSRSRMSQRPSQNGEWRTARRVATVRRAL